MLSYLNHSRIRRSCQMLHLRDFRLLQPLCIQHGMEATSARPPPIYSMLLPLLRDNYFSSLQQRLQSTAFPPCMPQVETTPSEQGFPLSLIDACLPTQLRELSLHYAQQRAVASDQPRSVPAAHDSDRNAVTEIGSFATTSRSSTDKEVNYDNHKCGVCGSQITAFICI